MKPIEFTFFLFFLILLVFGVRYHREAAHFGIRKLGYGFHASGIEAIG